MSKNSNIIIWSYFLFKFIMSLYIYFLYFLLNVFTVFKSFRLFLLTVNMQKMSNNWILTNFVLYYQFTCLFIHRHYCNSHHFNIRYFLSFGNSWIVLTKVFLKKSSFPKYWLSQFLPAILLSDLIVHHITLLDCMALKVYFLAQTKRLE